VLGLLLAACGNPTGQTSHQAGAQETCDGVAVDITSDFRNCGSCGYTCSGLDPLCCDSQCTDGTTDDSNCGSCGTSCGSGQVCIYVDLGTVAIPDFSGQCQVGTSAICALGGTVVSSVNTSFDPNNCGSCGYTCSGVLPLCCGAKCTDGTTDDSNCGSCGTSCGSGQSCVAVNQGTEMAPSGECQ
jgi:Stigma-specific protein, Stig1